MGVMQHAEHRVSTEQSVTPANEGELPLNPHITLKPTTTLNTDKHPANKRPVVWETVMMTFFFLQRSCKQASMPQEMSPGMIVLARLTS